MTRKILGLFVAVVSAASCFGQFSSGSTGADGALDFSTPGTYEFDPMALGKDADGDNVFQFTTINIGTGVTLRLRATKLRNRSVVWLATGAVTIAGTLDLSGLNGVGGGSTNSRTFAEPGPGGYPGGAGAQIGSTPVRGFGPGGGITTTNRGCGGAHANPQCGVVAYGNTLLVPLRGGSGGGGANLSGNVSGAGGGGGGGAIRIVSSGTITVNGSVLANGGNGGGENPGWSGGAGSGGAIHFQSNTFSGNGTIRANAGSPGNVGDGNTYGSPGRVRIDAANNSFTGTSQPAPVFGTPVALPLPTTAPGIRIVSVNGVAAPTAPTGSFVAPDVTINAANAVSVVIAASNVPLGTVARISLVSETGTDQTITCPGLAGTVAASTATCSATFPLGVTATLARVTW